MLRPLDCETSTIALCADPVLDTGVPLAYSILDVARLLGVGRSTVYAEIAAGRLKIRKVGRRSLVFAEELQRFVAELPSPTSGNS